MSCDSVLERGGWLPFQQLTGLPFALLIVLGAVTAAQAIPSDGPQSQTQISLRGCNGKFITAHDDGTISCDGLTHSVWERFALIYDSKLGGYTLQRFDGNCYLSDTTSDPKCIPTNSPGTSQTFEVKAYGANVSIKGKGDLFFHTKKDGELILEADPQEGNGSCFQFTVVDANAFPEYVGCYQGYNSSWDDRFGSLSLDFDSVTSCGKRCARRGNEYFGLECPDRSTFQCYCSSDLSGTQVRDEMCRKLHTPNGLRRCRGPFELSNVHTYAMGSDEIMSAYSTKIWQLVSDRRRRARRRVVHAPARRRMRRRLPACEEGEWQCRPCLTEPYGDTKRQTGLPLKTERSRVRLNRYCHRRRYPGGIDHRYDNHLWRVGKMPDPFTEEIEPPSGKCPSCPQDCLWGPYPEWSSLCTLKCGRTTLTRVRQVQLPAAHGGKCPLATEETPGGAHMDPKKFVCDKGPCPCTWKDWSSWGKCDMTCGGGVKTRSRTKTITEPAGYGECVIKDFVTLEGLKININATVKKELVPYWDKEKHIELRHCNTQICPKDCVWDDWQDWGDCSATCKDHTGLAPKRRSTRGKNDEIFGGQPCKGSDTREEACNTETCPVDCQFSDWTTSSCSKTCDGGIRVKQRSIQVTPQFGGKTCWGERAIEEECNPEDCDVTCVWDDWEPWGFCSNSCGTGVRSRMRSPRMNPDMPLGQLGLTSEEKKMQCLPDRAGYSLETEQCMLAPCPQNCVWDDWKDWGECSKSCGGGSRTRLRGKLIYEAHGGVCTFGEDATYQARDCNTQMCSIDCKLSAWTKWGACDRTCEGGVSRRTRSVVDEARFGGAPCMGGLNDMKLCNLDMPCPRACAWENWDEWGECSRTCGPDGRRMRTKISRSSRYSLIAANHTCSRRFSFGKTSSASDCEQLAFDRGYRYFSYPHHSSTGECYLEDAGRTAGASGKCREPTPNYNMFELRGGLREGIWSCARSTRTSGVRTVDKRNYSYQIFTVDACKVHCAIFPETVWLSFRFDLDMTNGFFGECTCLSKGASLVSSSIASDEVCWKLPDAWKSPTPLPRSSALASAWRQHEPVYCDGEGPDAGNGQRACDGTDASWFNSQCKLPVTIVFRFGRPTSVEMLEIMGKANHYPKQFDLLGLLNTSSGEKWRLIFTQVNGVDAASLGRAEEVNAAARSIFFGAAAGSYTTYKLVVKEGHHQCISISEVRFYSKPAVACKSDESRETGVCNSQWKCPTDCIWSSWGADGRCSVSCGGGIGVRTRHIVTPAAGGGTCKGSATGPAVPCATQPCPIDCVWDKWGGWSPCNETCGWRAHIKRTRMMKVKAQHGGAVCLGKAVKEKSCFKKLCDADCQWLSWLDWEDCTSSCGTGSRTRYRLWNYNLSKKGDPCKGLHYKLDLCNSEPCPQHCEWGPWREWSTCSGSCGGGFKRRTRSVMLEGAYNGLHCASEDANDYTSCGNQECPVDCMRSTWSEWSACSMSCGGGSMRRYRSTLRPAAFGGAECESARVHSRVCNENPCPQDCKWTHFSDWTNCPNAVGPNDFSKRDRVVLTDPLYGGRECTGGKHEIRPCSMPIKIDCEWDEWGVWTGCSESCGGGQRTRSRLMKILAQNNGEPCQGGHFEAQACGFAVCPFHCTWYDWGWWSQCSHPCGGGLRRRGRGMNNEHHGGIPCSGPRFEEESCNMVYCPVDCKWESWDQWTTCTSTCGRGKTERNRQVDVAAAYGGKSCGGDVHQTRACNLEGCPVDCVWKMWGAWSLCTRSCGSGEKERARGFVREIRGGQPCAGRGLERTPCAYNRCPINGVWLEWGDWQDCSKTCEGTKQRTRKYSLPRFGGGPPTTGQQSDKAFCGNDTCPEHCTFLSWGDWSKCLGGCGEKGTTMRKRKPLLASDWGRPCQEPAYETKFCKPDCYADCKWAQWTDWVGCAATKCISNKSKKLYKTRFRSRVPAHAGKGKPCVGPDVQKTKCVVRDCADCKYGDWQDWGPCQDACRGLQTRGRSVKGCPATAVTQESRLCNCLADACGKFKEACSVDLPDKQLENASLIAGDPRELRTKDDAKSSPRRWDHGGLGNDVVSWAALFAVASVLLAKHLFIIPWNPETCADARRHVQWLAWLHCPVAAVGAVLVCRGVPAWQLFADYVLALASCVTHAWPYAITLAVCALSPHWASEDSDAKAGIVTGVVAVSAAGRALSDVALYFAGPGALELLRALASFLPAASVIWLVVAAVVVPAGPVAPVASTGASDEASSSSVRLLPRLRNHDCSKHFALLMFLVLQDVFLRATTAPFLWTLEGGDRGLAFIALAALIPAAGLLPELVWLALTLDASVRQRDAKASASASSGGLLRPVALGLAASVAVSQVAAMSRSAAVLLEAVSVAVICSFVRLIAAR